MAPPVPTPADVHRTVEAETIPAIETVVAAVANLGEAPIADHVAAFEQAHQVLQEHLSEAGDG